MKTTTTLFFSLLVLCTLAQQKISFSILFPSDGYSLTTTARNRIDSVTKLLPNTLKAYSVDIAGHTDNEGDLAYNEELSDKRSETVKKYLLRKGFSKRLMTADGFAFLRPVADNEAETGKARNRRVQVTLQTIKPDVSRMADEKPLTINYTFRNNEEKFISYPSGTRMRVPANAFVHVDGSPVSGSVTVQYTEYRNVVDFMASDIPMSFRDENGEFVQFNSAGMFRIEAFNNDKKLQLKPNKRIDVNFAMTGTVPDMQMFRFNERSRKWNVETPPVAANLNAKNRFVAGNVAGCATLYEGKDYCTLWPDYANDMAIRIGYKLAGSSNPIYLKRSRHYFVSSKYPMQTYRLQVTERTPRIIRFRLVPESADNTKMNFGVFEWTYTSNEKYPFKESWEEGIWLRVKLEYLTHKDFYLSFFRNEEEVRLAVRGKLDNHNLHKNELRSFYANNKFSNIKHILEQKPRSEDFANVIEDSPEQRLKNDLCSDSLFCFYQWSREWMPDSTCEKALGFRAWLDYFNLNKEMMRERYENLKEQRDSILAAIKANEELRRRNEELVYARNYRQTGIVNELIQSVGISELGVWNCDQIYRLQAPIMVKKTYKDKEGKTVEPTSIFVLDPVVNGVLTFNGNYNMSPYEFQVSSTANNSLIAFDNQSNIYYCSPDDFSDALAKKGADIQLTAVAKNKMEEILRDWRR